MFETLFTLIFVASAIFLAAGSAVMGSSATTLGRFGLVLAPLLLAMYARTWFPKLGWLYLAVPAAAAIVLAAQARLPWQALRVPSAALPAL